MLWELFPRLVAVIAVLAVWPILPVAAQDDGQLLAYTRYSDSGSEIWLVNEDGSDNRRLGPGSEASWSPDGLELAFTLQREENSDIYIMSAVDGGGVTRLTDHPARDHGAPQSGDYDIYIMKADGSDLQRLTETPGAASYPTMSPDGSSIAYSYSETDGQVPRIMLMTADGGEQRMLVANGNIPRFAPR